MIMLSIRTLILYLIIVFGLRLMGKRQLGELQPSELVVTILVSNIATLPIEDTGVPLIGGITPILLLVCFEIFISWFSLKYRWARRLISGRPIVVVEQGKLIEQNLRDLRFSLDDLMEELRQNEVFDLREVEYAIVETNGKLSVLQKFNARNLSPDMIGLEPPPTQCPPPEAVISDGELNPGALRNCKLNDDWLCRQLSNEKILLKDVFLMICDQNGEYLIVPKERTGRPAVKSS